MSSAPEAQALALLQSLALRVEALESAAALPGGAPVAPPEGAAPSPPVDQLRALHEENKALKERVRKLEYRLQIVLRSLADAEESA